MRIARSIIMSGGGVRASPFRRMKMIAFLWIVCTLGTLAMPNQANSFYTQGRYGKREESYAQPSAFFSGSRYGRSEKTNLQGSQSDPKILEVSPRVDRFFLGSRYGKRGNDDNDLRSLPVRSPSKLSSLKRYEQALGYFDRIARANRIVKTIDRQRDHNDSQESDRTNVFSGSGTSAKIFNEYKRDNTW